METLLDERTSCFLQNSKPQFVAIIDIVTILLPDKPNLFADLNFF